MELGSALARYGHALGRWQAAWRFASSELRRAVALRQISAAWDIFRRDAGPGDVGPAHEQPVDQTGITSTEDPRRDGFLLWLAEHASPAIAEAATLLARAVGATRRFCEDDRTLLDTANDAVTLEPVGRGPVVRALALDMDASSPALAGLAALAAAVDRLRDDPAFVEGSGAESRLALPGGTFRHFVPADPAGTWALNLGLLARGTVLASPLPCPGLISRQLFRALEPEEIATALVEGAAAALDAGYARFEWIAPELARGHEALSHMSRNARARNVWPLMVALGGISRAQLVRALGLSRAGADIQAHALADAGLVALGSAGRIEWVRDQPPRSASSQAMHGDDPSGAFAEFDASMAEIDRLLARPSNPR